MNASLASSDSSESFARQAALDWLMGRINFERTALPYNQRQLKLDRMRQLLTRLGQPDAGLKIVHVAGTKGKGSTSAMVAAILTAAGYRGGVFSSPHLERIEERFAVDGQPCSAAELVALVDRVRPAVRLMDEEAAGEGDAMGGPTYFEITTAMALLHFVERQVDVVVLEVGLGGRLDSTNVCLPVVSVITSISFDHTKQLGNTLAAIAGEKAGIIKPGVPVVCGVQEAEPRQVIERIAREHGCRLIQAGEDFWFCYRAPSGALVEGKVGDGGSGKWRVGDCVSAVFPFAQTGVIDFHYAVAGQEYLLENASVAMRGAHQAANAAVALAVIAELRHQGWCISVDAMRQGLSSAILPGRVEVVASEPMVVFDTAHNPASARALAATLSELPRAGRRTLVLSVSRDKDVRSIVRELVPAFDRIVVTQYVDNPRAVAVERLAGIVREELGNRAVEVAVAGSPPEAWRCAIRGATPRELICIAGSFYLTAEMRGLVLYSALAMPTENNTTESSTSPSL